MGLRMHEPSCILNPKNLAEKAFLDKHILAMTPAVILPENCTSKEEKAAIHIPPIPAEPTIIPDIGIQEYEDLDEIDKPKPMIVNRPVVPLPPHIEVFDEPKSASKPAPNIVPPIHSNRVESFISSLKKEEKKPIMVESPEDLLIRAPKWAIAQKRPSKFWHRGKEYIQVVLISKIIGQRTFWAEWDGIGLIRTDKRAYSVPKKNVYGDIFIWDVDKKQSITEIIDIGEDDAEDSFHELQMFNMAYSVGRQAGANELDKKLGTLFILAILTFVAVLIAGILVYFRTKDLNGAVANVQAGINYLNATRGVI
jgi:hypothetical protein